MKAIDGAMVRPDVNGEEAFLNFMHRTLNSECNTNSNLIDEGVMRSSSAGSEEKAPAEAGQPSSSAGAEESGQNGAEAAEPPPPLPPPPPVSKPGRGRRHKRKAIPKSLKDLETREVYHEEEEEEEQDIMAYPDDVARALAEAGVSEDDTDPEDEADTSGTYGSVVFPEPEGEVKKEELGLDTKEGILNADGVMGGGEGEAGVEVEVGRMLGKTGKIGRKIKQRGMKDADLSEPPEWEDSYVPVRRGRRGRKPKLRPDGTLPMKMKRPRKPRKCREIKPRPGGDPNKPVYEEIMGQFRCVDCGFTTNNKTNVLDHVQRLHRVREKTCSICNKAYGTRRDLRRHIRSHSSFPCEKCGKMFRTDRGIKEHLKTHEEGYVKPQYPCEICGTTVSTPYVLKMHIDKVHMGINPKNFLCDFCGRAFVNRHVLTEHRNTHTGDTPFKCEMCGAAFTYTGGLRIHKRRVHGIGKQRSYECKICFKAYKCSGGLRVHMEQHSDRGPRFRCDTCGRAFYQKGAMQRHMRTHTGERPFKCELCASTFADTSILRRHMMGRHKMQYINRQRGRERTKPDHPSPAYLARVEAESKARAEAAAHAVAQAVNAMDPILHPNLIPLQEKPKPYVPKRKPAPPPMQQQQQPQQQPQQIHQQLPPAVTMTPIMSPVMVQQAQIPDRPVSVDDYVAQQHDRSRTHTPMQVHHVVQQQDQVSCLNLSTVSAMQDHTSEAEYLKRTMTEHLATDDYLKHRPESQMTPVPVSAVSEMAYLQVSDATNHTTHATNLTSNHVTNHVQTAHSHAHAPSAHTPHEQQMTPVSNFQLPPAMRGPFVHEGYFFNPLNPTEAMWHQTQRHTLTPGSIYEPGFLMKNSWVMDNDRSGQTTPTDLSITTKYSPCDGL